VSNFAALSSEPAEVFGRLTIPRPWKWDASKGEEGSSGEVWKVSYADLTTCGAASSLCAHVVFYDQDTLEGRQLFGKNPVKWWTNQPCAIGTKGKTEGPVSVKLGGQSAKLYRVLCNTGDLTYNYAWFIPGKKLFITGSIGSAGTLAAETVQAALEKASGMS
jgi:hypothetical protein